jgi:hypothetical protein
LIGCCAPPLPAERSASASNRAATLPASGNVPQAPCDLSSKGGLLSNPSIIKKRRQVLAVMIKPKNEESDEV